MLHAIKKNKLTHIVAFIILLLTLIAPTSIYAQTTPTVSDEAKQSARCGSNIELGTPTATCSTVNGSTDLNTLIKNIINIFSAVVGAVSVIMIIIGGFRYITSGGDSNNVGAAKNTILYAIVGLVLVAVAQIIVQFILERTT